MTAPDLNSHPGNHPPDALMSARILLRLLRNAEQQVDRTRRNYQTACSLLSIAVIQTSDAARKGEIILGQKDLIELATDVALQRSLLTAAEERQAEIRHLIEAGGVQLVDGSGQPLDLPEPPDPDARLLAALQEGITVHNLTPPLIPRFVDYCLNSLTANASDLAEDFLLTQPGL